MKIINSKVLQFKRNRFLMIFFFAHLFIAGMLGENYIFAPDESAYVFTFENIYTRPGENPQFASGWITSPQIFLWIIFLPAKLVNIMGVSSTLALRILSILLVSVSYVILRNILEKNTRSQLPRYILNFAFTIPSVFFWTTLGLRESYILFAFVLFSSSLWNFLETKRYIHLFVFSLSGYSLLCVKNYLYFVFALTLILTLIISLAIQKNRSDMVIITGFFLVLPLVIFRVTSTPYAFEFMYSSIFSGNISDTADRSGESVTKVKIKVSQETNSQETNSQETNSQETNSQETNSQIVLIRGDYTLIAAYNYFLSPQEGTFKKILSLVGLEKIVESEYKKKISSSLSDTVSSQPKGTFTPGNFGNPLSMTLSSLYFVFGPFPPNHDKGFFGYLISFESPIWWIFYLFAGALLFGNKSKISLTDLIGLIHLILLSGLILMSSLVEVNIGTAFRHKSILIVPLLFVVFTVFREKIDKDRMRLN